MQPMTPGGAALPRYVRSPMKKRAAVRKTHTPRLPPEHEHHAVVPVEQHRLVPSEPTEPLGETFIENETSAEDVAAENPRLRPHRNEGVNQST